MHYSLLLSVTLLFTYLTSILSVNHLQAFQKWFLKNGGRVNGLDIHDFPEMGRGLLATRNISKGEKILFIPKKLILSSNHAKTSNDPLHRQLYESFSSKDNELMIAFILLEKARGKDSFWYPYLNVLPTYVPNLAQFDKEELSELQSPAFSDEVIDSWHQTIKSFNYFHDQIQTYWPSDPQLVTLQEYMWASSIVDSRGFRFRGEINLAPFSDMFNYSPHPDPRPPDAGNFFLEHHILSKDGLEVHADRDCQAELQLFEDYGDNSDRIYLQYHGFMPENNPFRCVQISAHPMDHPNISPKKQELLKEFRFKRAPSKCVDAAGDLGQPLTAYLALLALNEEEVQYHSLTLFPLYPPRSLLSFTMAIGISLPRNSPLRLE
jgi:protein-histidine N-methyltransferase